MGARQSSLRAINLASVTERLFAAADPLSRADLATNTGLTRSTVSRLVDELIAHDLVTEVVPVVDGQRGRPAVPLVPAAGTWLGLGLEINIRHSAACLVDLAGNVVAERFVTHDLTGLAPEVSLRLVGRLGRQVLAEAESSARLVGVHLAIPGLVDTQRRLLLRAPNLGWWYVDPAEPVIGELGVDVGLLSLGNEADYAAVTVARDAPGRPSALTDFLYVSGEVGIGAALVSDGALMGGRHGWAGEIGHVCVDPDGPECACGARGCLERYVGQQALLETAGCADIEALLGALDRGDDRAGEAVRRASVALGVALAGALNLLDVSQVVLGGHLGQVLPQIDARLRGELERRVIAAPFAPIGVTTVVLDEAPSALGAAYVAVEALLRDPADWLDHDRVAQAT